MTFESWCQDSCRCCIGFLSPLRKGGTWDIWSAGVSALEIRKGKKLSFKFCLTRSEGWDVGQSDPQVLSVK